MLFQFIVETFIMNIICYGNSKYVNIQLIAEYMLWKF